MTPEDLILVSVDDHVVEPPTLFDQHLTEEWKPRAPRVVRKKDGTDMWVFEGETPDPMAGGLIPMRIETRMDGRDREINDFYKPGPDGTMYRMMELVYERR